MSDAEIVLSASGLGKAYRLHLRADERLSKYVSGAGRRGGEEFWALKNVDLALRRGEALGVIGENGAGKSTLLRLLCGTLRPSAGTAVVKGRMAALLELGSGFNPRFTGRENVWLNAAVLGLSKAQISERFGAIAEFAGIGEFMDLPVKLYSSGMQARLGFAVSAHVDADIMIVDEILAVGDAAFAQKCHRYLERFRAKGTLLFVSHNSGLVAKLCDRALWLDHGEVRALGPAAEVCADYVTNIAERGAAQEIRAQESPGHRWRIAEPPPLVRDSRHRAPNRIAVSPFNPDAPWHGHGGADILEVSFSGGGGQRLGEITGADEVELRIVCRAERDLVRPILGFLLRDRLGQNVFGDNTYLACRDAPRAVRVGETFVAVFRFQFPFLAPGDYGLTVAITEGSQEDHIHIHWIEEALVLNALESPVRRGIVGIPATDVCLEMEGTPS
ncbi:MAG TPA: ABC transporter ATP-binding protein [Rhizomicrobium sp.]|jgi:lipopolysaccharide transport system ATP-binding protein